jgi:hypothetical protein
LLVSYLELFGFSLPLLQLTLHPVQLLSFGIPLLVDVRAQGIVCITQFIGVLVALADLTALLLVLLQLLIKRFDFFCQLFFKSKLLF